MTTTDSANLLTTRQVAERLGTTPQTIARWVAAGKLTPAFKVTGKTGPMLFRPADLANLERRTTDPVA